jgi:hypothetical protein
VRVTMQTLTARATGRSATVDVVEMFSFRARLVSEIGVFRQDSHPLLATLGSRQGQPRGRPLPPSARSP